MSSRGEHVPVLFRPVVDLIAPRPGGRYIDGTVGAGGHAAGLLEASTPDSRLLGFDADPAALAVAARNLAVFGDRVALVHSNFEHLEEVAQSRGFIPADGIVLDLGLSSMHLDDAARGFSFRGAALDMRMNPDDETTAADLVNGLDESELADLIFEYGEERASRRIARAIVTGRPFATAEELAQAVERAVGRHGRIHPATRTFQALRIAVNRELEVLKAVLPQAVDALGANGRVGVISFHSLEDRIVKTFFRESPKLVVLTKHPVRPTTDEMEMNPRSRSAKLRVAARSAN